MVDRDGEVFRPVPVAGSGTRRGAWLATAGVTITLLGVVGAGVLGRASPPGPAVQPSPSAEAQGGPGAVGTPAGEPSRGPGAVGNGDVVVVPEAGYEVDYVVDAEHRPSILDHGALATFGFGPRTGSGVYDGIIRVSVGTPARGAAILGADGPGVVYGATLDELRTAYLGIDPGRIMSRVVLEIDHELAILIRIGQGATGARATALVVHGGRNFVLTAAGFHGIVGDVADNPAVVGLARFVDGFRFGTSLFVSRELGFQVPLPVAVKPFGVAVNLPRGEPNGLYVFDDGEPQGDAGYSHSIGVSVGSASRPALVRMLPSDRGPPRPWRIWAATLVELQAAYLAAVGGTAGSSTTLRLDGELALMIEGPDGLAVVVLTVHHGRVYIIATTGSSGPEAAPGFGQFLDGFAFLD